MRPYTFVAVAVLGPVACSHQPMAPRDPSSAEGLTLSLAVTHSQPQRGESDSITVTLTNTNPDTVSLIVGGCPLLFYVTDAGGMTVVPAGGDWVCIAVIGRLQLAPGGHESRTFVWTTTSLPPGAYSVYGTFAADGLHLAPATTAVQLH